MGRLRSGGGGQSLHGRGPNPAGQPGPVRAGDWLVQTLWHLLIGQRTPWRGQGERTSGETTFQKYCAPPPFAKDFILLIDLIYVQFKLQIQKEMVIGPFL